MTEPLLRPDEAGELRDLLQKVGRWRFAASRWETVHDVLTALRDALAGGRRDEVRRLSRDLKRMRPVRIQTEPGPEQIQSQPDGVTHLVHEVDALLRDRQGGSNPDDGSGSDH